MRYITFILALITVQLSAQIKVAEPTYSLTCPKGLDTVRYQGVLVLMAPLDGAGDNFTENLNIVSQDAPLFADSTLEGYLKFNIDQMSLIGVKVDEVLDEKIGKAGYKAKVMVYQTEKYMQDESVIKLRQWLVKHNNKFFVVTYTCRPAEYNRYLPVMQRAVETIVFK